MADIVPTLFGFSPQMYQQQQQQRADEQALQYAKLDPFEQANYAIGRGAYGLAGAIGGALGGQDPELQRITARQQIAQQIDLTDPASIRQGMTMLRDAGDTVGLQQLAQVYRQQQESNALVAQRTAAATKERTQALPTDVQTARELANLEDAAVALQGMEASPERDEALRRVNSQLTNLRNLTAKPGEKDPSFGAEAERAAKAKFGKTFAKLTPAEAAEVDRDLENRGIGRAKAGAAQIVMPGDKDLVDIPKFRADVQKTIRPLLDTVTATDNALTGIEDSIKNNNFISFNAARVQLAKSLGDNQLSRRDVEQAGGDPSILGGLADTASTLFTKTPTLDTQNQIKSTLLAIKKVATDKANAEIASQRKIALRNKKYDPVAVDEALDFSEFRPAPVATQYATNPTTKARIMSTDGGKTWTPVR